MLKVAFCLYRQWGYDIFENILAYQKIRKDFLIDTLIVVPDHQFDTSKNIKKQIKTYIVSPYDTKKLYTILSKNKIDIVFWYSWSWIVRKPLLDDFISLCLHPSLLPKYRGGTPIQHQIINGEKTSGVTIFRMTDRIDAGPIYKQEPMSIAGTVNDIILRMTDIGTVMTKNIIQDAANNELVFIPQNKLKKHLPNKRRTPSQSEIKLEELNKITYKQLYNLVRGLLDPYPNAYITINNHQVLIQAVEKCTVIPANAFVISYNKSIDFQSLKNNNNLYLKVKDGYAKLVKFTIK